MQLKIEVLVNSPGPHDSVRIRQPFEAIQRLGIDCRIHERPFRFQKCIRPNSLVIWQRPLPSSEERMKEHLEWLRERGCILLIDWDDHPELLPNAVVQEMKNQKMAALKYNHCILTSNTELAEYLSKFNPLCITLENGVEIIRELNKEKHAQEFRINNKLKVFIGNLNRAQENTSIERKLRSWIERDQRIELVMVGQKDLEGGITGENVQAYEILDYQAYRSLLSTCHIALAPLENNKPNNCKTVLKWQECAAESVAVIGGPALYKKQLSNDTGIWVNSLADIVTKAEELSIDHMLRINLVTKAWYQLNNGWTLGNQLYWRLWLLGEIWKKRYIIDKGLVKRLKLAKNFGSKNNESFTCEPWNSC